MLWAGVFDLLNENVQDISNNVGSTSDIDQTRKEKMLSIEWIGQTTASLCWIISVFVYESDVNLWSNGDWLQLAAASSWMLSNIASVVMIRKN